MNDYAGAATDFNTIFDFLHSDYFPRVIFRLVYLLGYKIYIFSDNLELLGFKRSAIEL